jgi:hypothetical protein
MWWGGWILFNYPNKFEFNDFLISNFALLFSLFGLGAAFQDMSDRKEMEKSASRVFYLLDRKSSIDPLGSGGKILNTSIKKKRKSSVRRKKSLKALDHSERSDTEATDDVPVPESGKKKKTTKKKSSKKLEVDTVNVNPESPKKRKSLKTKKKSQKKVDEMDE